MKGIVFTEFLELVENKFGFEISDKIVNSIDSETNGVYTAIGTYSHTEMVNLVIALSKETDISVDDLLYAYGKHFFYILNSSYPKLINKHKSLFTFFESIENHIHVEVKKLYPDAELPTINTSIISKKEMHLEYISERCLGKFAHGLLESASVHFDKVSSISILKKNQSGSEVTFKIQL